MAIIELGKGRMTMHTTREKNKTSVTARKGVTIYNSGQVIVASPAGRVQVILEKDGLEIVGSTFQLGTNSPRTTSGKAFSCLVEEYALGPIQVMNAAMGNDKNHPGEMVASRLYTGEMSFSLAQASEILIDTHTWGLYADPDHTLIIPVHNEAGRIVYLVGNYQRRLERWKMRVSKLLGRGPDKGAMVILRNRPSKQK